MPSHHEEASLLPFPVVTSLQRTGEGQPAAHAPAAGGDVHFVDGVGKSARITVEARRLRRCSEADGAAMSVLGGKTEDICSSGDFRLLIRNGYAAVMPKLTRMSGDVTFFRLKDTTAWTGF